MTWLLPSVWQHLASFQTLLLLAPAVAFFLWKCRKRNEARFLQALQRRERITRRLLET